MAKKSKQHYIDNESFTEAVIEYSKKCKEAEERGLERPKMSEYIGKCIYDISSHLAYRPNFNGYSWKDDMISDAYENICKYLSNFDAEKMIEKGKKPNAFAYVTQIAYFAFLRRIEKEKKQSMVKDKVLENSGLFGEIASMQEGDDTEYYNQFVHNIMNNPDYNPKED